MYKYRLLHSSRSLSCFQDLSDASRITLGFALSNYLQHPEGFTKLVPKIFIYDVIFVNIYASRLVCGKHVSYTCWKQFSYQWHLWAILRLCMEYPTKVWEDFSQQYKPDHSFSIVTDMCRKVFWTSIGQVHIHDKAKIVVRFVLPWEIFRHFWGNFSTLAFHAKPKNSSQVPLLACTLVGFSSLISLEKYLSVQLQFGNNTFTSNINVFVHCHHKI